MEATSAPAPAVQTMRAIVQTEYGSAEVLSLAEVNLPALPDELPEDRVLVRVHAASVNAGDWHLMRGTPFLVRLIYGGLRRPRFKTLGSDVAGEVVAVGKAVAQFRVGDAVFGDLSESGFGAFAEYVCVPETALVSKPSSLSFEEASIVPVSALAALQGLRDVGQLQAGQRVLIKGASGGVGSFAVQIAKAFGVEVTALCRSSKADWLRAIGADCVLDSTQAASTLNKQHYDLIFDAAAYSSVFEYLPALKPQGTYVMVGGSTGRIFQVLLFGAIISKISGRRVKCLASKPNQADLMVVKDLIEAGKIRPQLDRCYPLSEVAAAIQALEQRQVQGKIAIRI